MTIALGRAARANGALLARSGSNLNALRPSSKVMGPSTRSPMKLAAVAPLNRPGFTGAVHIDTFKEVLAMKKKTSQYEDRLGEFMSFRKKYYPDTYWLFHY